jgi:anaphase-promoting complex subunit 3
MPPPQAPTLTSQLPAVLPATAAYQSALHPPIARPLSSAEESGPVLKKLRSTSRAAGKGSAAAVDDAPKKARARPALHLSNFFSSSSGRRSQPKAPAATRNNAGATGKGEREPPTRRSTRLLGGGGNRPTVKVS